MSKRKKIGIAIGAAVICIAAILAVVILLFKKNTVTLKEESAQITLSDEGTTVVGSGVEVDGSKVTITNPGDYEVNGSLSDGRIVIDVASGTVNVTLNGASITCSDKDAIYSKDAADVNVIVTDGTQNSLISGTENFEVDENELDEDGSYKNKQQSAIYVKGNLAISGTGDLSVTGYIYNGIQAKGTLTVEEANITINAINHGMKSGDEMYLSSGTSNVVSGQDAFHSNLNITVSDGTYTIEAGDDGIHADGELTIDNGTITISKSYEGLEGHIITINDGDIDITSSDDGLNASGGSSTGFGMDGGNGMKDSNFDPSTMKNHINQESGTTDGSEPTFPDGEVPTDGSQPTLPDGEVPTDGSQPTPPDGEVPTDGSQPTPPDGTAPADGTGNQQQQDMQNGANSANTDSAEDADTDEDSKVDSTTMPELTINGGTIRVNAEGDGLDSNGNMTINGGTVYVDGPSNGGNSALDYGTENGGILTINGGTVIAIGMSDMLEAVDATSTQTSLMYVFGSTVAAGTEVKVTDSNGTEILSFTPAKNADSVIVSSPDMEQGLTYTFTYGESTEEITATEINATNYSGQGMGGMGGMKDKGQRPDHTNQNETNQMNQGTDAPTGSL